MPSVASPVCLVVTFKHARGGRREGEGGGWRVSKWHLTKVSVHRDEEEASEKKERSVWTDEPNNINKAEKSSTALSTFPTQVLGGSEGRHSKIH